MRDSNVRIRQILIITVFCLFVFYCFAYIVEAKNINNNDFNYCIKRSETVKIPVREASGIAVDLRSNLFYVHEDSHNPNVIYVFTSEGKLKNQFKLQNLVNRDWEDITGDNKGTFWIIDSKFAICEFKTDVNGNLITDSTKTYALPEELKGKNIESLDYLPDKDKFVAIFKGHDNKIFEFKLNNKHASYMGKIPDYLKAKPSGLTHNPVTGNFFVLAFWGHKIIEISPDFRKIVNIFNLPSRLLFSFQPEGIVFDQYSNLIIVCEKPWYSIKGHSRFIKLLKK